MDETKNFNSHAHVERDDRVRKMVVEFEISTHTLTWSVTTVSFVIPFGLPISTHTLTWSVTQDLLKDSIKETISTHTLTWSVTRTIEYTLKKAASFQLTRSRGA